MEHTFLYEKNKITITGVIKVETFDERETKIRLKDNVIVIKGKDFIMQEMAISHGKAIFNGTIFSVNYLQKIEKTSFINKLFK